MQVYLASGFPLISSFRTCSCETIYLEVMQPRESSHQNLHHASKIVSKTSFLYKVTLSWEFSYSNEKLTNIPTLWNFAKISGSLLGSTNTGTKATLHRRQRKKGFALLFALNGFLDPVNLSLVTVLLSGSGESFQ